MGEDICGRRRMDLAHLRCRRKDRGRIAVEGEGSGERDGYFSGGKIGSFAGKVKMLSFRSLLISTDSEYISNSFSPLRNRRMLSGHFTPPPTSRYFAKIVSSLSKSLNCSLRRLNS